MKNEYNIAELSLMLDCVGDYYNKEWKRYESIPLKDQFGVHKDNLKMSGGLLAKIYNEIYDE